MSAPLDPPFGTYAPTSLQQAVIDVARSTILHRGDFRPAVGATLTMLRKDGTFAR